MGENWKDIPGHEGRYQVSDQGRVRSLDRVVEASDGTKRRYRGKVLRPGTMNRFGHVSVALGKGNSKCVHDLVLRAFVGEPGKGQECRHVNTVGSDNRLRNLAWGSRSENGKDVTAAEKRKFTYEQVSQIRKLRAEGALLRDLADMFDSCTSHMSYVCSGDYYGV